MNRSAARLAPLVLALLCWAGRAHAHPPPYATGIAVHGEGETRVVAVLTNRGVLLSRDGGGGYQYVCHDAVGYRVAQEPPFAIAADGRLLMATTWGMVRGSEDYCDYPLHPALGGLALPALVADPAGASRFHTLSGVGGIDNRHYLSDDSGESWTGVGEAMGDYLLESLVISPSMPNVMYGAGWTSALEAVVAASDDGGQTFTRHALALTPEEVRGSVLGVDPQDASRLFVGTRSADPNAQPDRLLRSTDGGQGFEQVHALTGSGGFAMSPDGAQVWVGGYDGLYRSMDRGETFSRIGDLSSITCLAHIDGLLWVCGLYAEGKLGVVRSDNGGADFELALAFEEVTAQLSCDAGSDVGDRCAASFREWQREVLGFDPDADPDNDAGMTPISDDTGGDAGGVGDSDDPDDPDNQGGPGVVDLGPGAKDTGAGGCGCRIAPAQAADGESPGLLALLGLLLGRAGLRAHRRQRRP